MMSCSDGQALLIIYSTFHMVKEILTARLPAGLIDLCLVISISRNYDCKSPLDTILQSQESEPDKDIIIYILGNSSGPFKGDAYNLEKIAWEMSL